MKSIVAIQLKRIGDLILTIPALEALRKTYPNAQIFLVIDGDTAGLVPAIRCVDRILVYRKNSFNFDTFRRLIFGRYDATLDFTGTDRSSLLTSLTKAARRVAFRWADKNQVRSKVYTEFVDSPVRDQHTVDHYLDLVAAIGVERGDGVLHLEIPQSSYRRIGEILAAEKIDPTYIVIHPGLRGPRNIGSRNAGPPSSTIARMRCNSRVFLSAAVLKWRKKRSRRFGQKLSRVSSICPGN